MKFKGTWSFEVTIKGASSSKNFQTISFEGIRLKEFEGIWSFFSLYAPGVTQAHMCAIWHKSHCCDKEWVRMRCAKGQSGVGWCGQAWLSRGAFVCFVFEGT
jgi:hypothetical protein